MAPAITDLQAVLHSDIEELRRGIELLQTADIELIKVARSALGGPQAVARWLSLPNPSLQNAVPLELAQTPKGRAAVLESLNQIRYGMYS